MPVRGILLLALVIAVPATAAPTTGVAVLQSEARGTSLADWEPTARYLTDGIPGRSFEIVPLAPDEVAPAIADGRVAFAITDPAGYLEIEERHGATRLLTTQTRWNGVSTREYGAVVFARSDRADVRALADLRGRSLVAVGSRSFGGWLMARLALDAVGVAEDDLQRLVFAGSPDAAVLAVREGRGDAGTARTGTLERMIAAGSISPGELRVLARHEPSHDFPYVRSTPLYPEWPIAALGGTPAEAAREVVLALLALPPDAPAARAAGIAGWSIAASDAPVRAALARLDAGGAATDAPDGARSLGWPYAALVVAAAVLLLAAARRGRLDWLRARSLQARLEREATLRRRVESDLREATLAADDLFNRAPCGMHALDADGLFIEVNDPELALLGYERDEIVGRRRFSDLLTPASQQRFAREFPLFKERGHIEEVEFDLVRKDGSTVPVLLSATAVYDDGGRYVRSRSVVFVNRERTLVEDSLQRQYATLDERVRERTMELTAVIGTLQEEIRSRESAEALLLQSEQRATAIVDAVVDGVVTVDERGFVESFNASAERMFGWSAEDVVGRPLSLLLGRDARNAARDAVRDGGEVVGRRRDGAPFPLELTVSEMRLGARRVFLHVMRDLTESKQASERLQQLAEELRRNEVMAAIGSLVAGFAHEARNPLFGISAVVDALCARLGDREELREHVTLLRRDVQRLSDLTRDLLEFGKPAPATLAPGDLVSVLHDAIVQCRPLAAEKDVELAAALDEARCRVERNDRLVRAFQNLLQNAIQFAPPHTTVRLETARVGNGAGGWVECRIADRGPGLEEEDLPRLFEPFFTRRRGGTGLGLAIVRRIVEEHHGSIAAGNDPAGGAVISIRLPIAA